jgi:hypothetical protein
VWPSNWLTSPLNSSWNMDKRWIPKPSPNDAISTL